HRPPRHHAPRPDDAHGAPPGAGGREGVRGPAAAAQGSRGRFGGRHGRRRRPAGGVRDPRRHSQRHGAGLPHRRGPRLALGAAPGAGVGVRPPHGPAARHRGRKPLDRSRRGDHGHRPQGARRERRLSVQRLDRGGVARGPRGVRGGAAARGVGRVVTRRGWAIAIFAAWSASLGWLVKREFFRTTGARLAEAALSVPPGAVYYRLAFGGDLKPGSRYTIRTFDPLLLAERDVVVTIAAESTLVVADSADYDSTAMAWVPVRFDTVRAFRIDEETNGVETSAWIDAQG